MLNYCIRRLLLIFPTLIGITAVTFFVMALSPGGVGASLMNKSEGLKSNDMQALRKYYDERYGLNRNLFVQYAHWLNQISPLGFRSIPDSYQLGSFGFKSPDLGESYSQGRPVIDLFAERLPVTLLLNLLAFPFIYGISILSGVYAARHKGGTWDRFSGSLYLVLWSFPVILAGVLMIGYLANVEHFHWFPANGLHDLNAEHMSFLPHMTPAGFSRGWLLDTLWHLALPVVCLVYGSLAFLAKLSRGTTLDNLHADFARTARAKGLDERTILFRHVLRNGMMPLITVAADILPAMLGGSLIVESIFGIPGMGKLGVDATFNRDRELVMAATLIAGIIGLLSYLACDILYAVADPRVSYE